MADLLALRLQGNSLFLQGKYLEALKLYTDDSLSEDVAAHSNAAETCIRLKRPQDAVIHARRALVLDSTHSKSVLRLACALAALGRIAEAHISIAESPLSDGDACSCTKNAQYMRLPHVTISQTASTSTKTRPETFEW